MFDLTNHKSNGLVITSYNEVCKRIVYILDNINVYFYWWFYDTAAINTKVVSSKSPPLLLQHITKNKYIHNKLITTHYVLFLLFQEVDIFVHVEIRCMYVTFKKRSNC